MLKFSAAFAGLALAATCFSPSAFADESEYLARLDKAQVSHMSARDALSWGYTVCDKLRAGDSVPEVLTVLEDAGGFRRRHAGVIIGAAAHELCPDQYQTVMDWAHEQTHA